MTESPAGVRASAREVGPTDRLFLAQREAARSRDLLVVVQGGPGTGKTEAVMARVLWLVLCAGISPRELLILAPAPNRAELLRARLRAELMRRRAPQTLAAEAAAAVTGVADLVEQLARAAMPDLVVTPDPEATDGDVVAVVAHRLLIERLAGGEVDGGAFGESAMLRRGAAVVRELVFEAQAEVLRRLRAFEFGDEDLAALVGRLQRPVDVRAHAGKLCAAIALASRRAPADRAALEQIAALLDTADVDFGDAVRREALAAPVRARIYGEALGLLARAAPAVVPRDALAPLVARRLEDAAWLREFRSALRHVLVDDAQDLTADEATVVRRLSREAALFVVGDLRAVGRGRGSRTVFCGLLRDVRRPVLLLDAPRYSPACGRFINAVGTRLWPARERGGFAPALGRGPAAGGGEGVELWLVRRRVRTDPDGHQHPEPIADARGREASVVADRVAEILAAEPRADLAVLTLSATGHPSLVAALDAVRVPRGRVPILTIAQSRGREWATVLVAQLDDHFGASQPCAGGMDAETGLPLIDSVLDGGRRVEPFSTPLLLARAAARREDAARCCFFLAVSRARQRLVLSGVTRERAAGLRGFATPIEWLRHALGVTDLRDLEYGHALDGAPVRVGLVDSTPSLTASR